MVVPEFRDGQMRRVTVLGSTGSVGCSTIDLLKRNRERFQVEALAAGTNWKGLAEQARELSPAFVALADKAGESAIRDALSGLDIEIGVGEAAIVEAARRDAEITVAAIVGAAGLRSTFEALSRGAIVALANKEALVCSGALFMEKAKRTGATILPVDSEHNAIFQVFDEERRSSVSKIVLTASGGPFRCLSFDEMSRQVPEAALAHPNWEMGRKISIDSATMMNKGLELIEAHHLFGLDNRQIEVLVHPQSVIHSMVEYVDGSVLAQLGTPDMRIPIAYALAWPERIETPVERLNLSEIAQLTFETPDEERFPALRLARQALASGDRLATILNAANECAVEAFLDHRIRFTDIAEVSERMMQQPGIGGGYGAIDELFELDVQTREVAKMVIEQFESRSTIAVAALGD